MSLLSLQNISKSYGARPVLCDVNVTVDEGEFVAIVGYSGMGKTTLMNMVAGLVPPDAGTVMFDGKPVTGTTLDRVLIFQNYSLLPWFSALRNVELAVAQAFPKFTRAQVTAQATAALEKVKLGHALNRKPGELSGGMRQRVSLARGLAMNPRILLLDEPLGALDALTRSELQDELVRIQQEEKCTLLMVTNDVDEAIIVADRIVPLSAGPGATLGDPIAVTVPRPRDRRALNNDPAYHHDRKTVLHYLLSHGPRDLKLRGKSHTSFTAQKPVETKAKSLEEVAA
ncbi:MAG: ABC transporter ATP-binding protein [Verrucomicrobiae bacterium]|nr:ABC transporter ATP-binding protein [Verrucomicrobiae bacterium]